ncbi:MAG: antitoxin family protein [Planctomycetes bacterium]|nr:antitoxin family protein [Planctomycetota bacterium]
MSRVEAVYRHGVFEPLEPVNLREEERVRLRIEPAGEQCTRSWLDEVRALQADVVRRHGPLPDSASDIGADRVR